MSSLYPLRSTPQRIARSKPAASALASLPSLGARTPSTTTLTTSQTPPAKKEEDDHSQQASSARLAAELVPYAYSTRSSSGTKRPASPALDKTPKKQRIKSETPSPKKQKPIQMERRTPHPAPKNWEQVYDLIKEMRNKLVAAVDTMGCHRPQDAELDPKSRRLTILISLMLSSQTKDETTSQAVTNLQHALGGHITVDGLLKAPDATVEAAICKVGFWRRKTQYIRQSMIKLRDEFDSDVPKTVDELCSLPGVGPKMAFLALQAAWDINVGIGVDTHVHRITNRLGWHKPPTTTPEQTRLNLQSWLPKEKHAEINHMLVGFGQALCFPVAPRCDLCTLSTRKLCPGSQKVGSVKGRKEIVWKDGQGGEAKVEVELREELGRTEMKVEVPGEGQLEVDVNEEKAEVDGLVGEVMDAAKGKEVGGKIKATLEW